MLEAIREAAPQSGSNVSGEAEEDPIASVAD
jgi:hypothetical protein